MRLLAVFLLIPTVGALAALLWGLVLAGGDVGALRAALEEGRLPGRVSGGAGPGAADPPEPGGAGGFLDLLGLGGPGLPGASLDPAARFAALVEREVARDAIGPGESRGGIAIERADATSAVVLLPTGQRVTVTAPQGFRIAPRFSAQPGGLGGAWALLRAETGPPLAISFADIETLRTANLREKIAAYGTIAGSLAQQTPPAGVVLSDFHHDGRGVFYCMTVERAGLDLLVGGRLDRGLFVTSLLRPGCGDPDAADLARLGLAVGAVEPERWR